VSSEAGGGLYYPDSAGEAAPDPSAILAGIRERRARVVAANLNADAFNDAYAAMVRLAREDSALLLAAVGAVLELADDWTATSDELDDRTEHPGTDEEARPILQGEALAYNSCAQHLREAITSALTGKEGSEDE
jgi:hypothetical protein